MKYTLYFVLFSFAVRVMASPQEDPYSHFQTTADALSKDISITIQSDSNQKDEKSEFDIKNFCFSLNSKNKIYAFSMYGKSIRNAENVFKSDGQTFFYGSFNLSFGGVNILSRKITRMTETTQKQITAYIQEINELSSKKNNTITEKARMSKIKEEINNLNLLQADERSFGDERIKFKMFDPTFPASTNNRMVFIKDKEFKGNNPSGELQIRYGMEKSWAMEQRSGFSNLKDLYTAGLIDNPNLILARVSLFGLPIDAWMPGKTPINKNTINFQYNSVIPGWEGGPKSIVLGKTKIIPEIEPNKCKNIKNNASLETFMVDARNKNPINIQRDYERTNRLDVTLPDGSKSELILPIAGMDEDNKTFVITWFALPGYNGMICMVQYENEPEPRIGYFDPSGVIVRVESYGINIGFINEAKKDKAPVTDKKILWSDHSNSKSNKKGKFVPEISLGISKTKSSCDLNYLDLEKPKEKKYVMPRSLW